MLKVKQSSYLTGWLICLVGTAFYCYEYLLRIEPSVMVNELMQQFKVTAAGFGLITALYYYAYTPMQVAVGLLVDRYGTKLMIGLAALACALGSFLFSISYSIGMAASARFLIGFGSSFAFVGVLKLAAEWLPLKHFAMFAGITTALGMLAGMVGDISLISLVHKIGWRNTQHLGTAIGLVLIPLIFFFVHDSPKAKRKSHSNDFKDTLVYLKKMIRTPQMWLIGLIGSSLYLSLSAFAELWGIKFLQSVYVLTAEKAGIASSMVFIGWLIGGPFNGWLSDRIKSRKKPLLMGGWLAAVAIGIIILKPAFVTFEILCALLLLFGVFSSTEIICFAISRESNPHHITGTAIAFTNLLVMVGGIVFQPLLGILLDLFWTGGTINNVRFYSIATYQWAFAIIPICLVISSLLTMKLTETLKK